MLVVVEDLEEFVRIVTAEDAEEILQDEIVGDDDQYIDGGTRRRPGLARQNSKAYDPLVLMRPRAARSGAPPDPPSMARGGPSPGWPILPPQCLYALYSRRLAALAGAQGGLQGRGLSPSRCERCAPPSTRRASIPCPPERRHGLAEDQRAWQRRP